METSQYNNSSISLLSEICCWKAKKNHNTDDLPELCDLGT